MNHIPDVPTHLNADFNEDIPQENEKPIHKDISSC